MHPETSRRNRRYGLHIKIIAWTFVPTLAILAGVALFTFISYQRVTEDLVLTRNQELTRLSASQLAGELRTYTDLLSEIAVTTDLRQATSAQQAEVLQRFSNRLVVFDGGVVVLDTFGTLTAALPARPDDLDQDWSDREYYQRILRLPRPVYADILPDGPQGAEVIVAAAPISGDQGELLGVLAGMFRMGAREVSSFYGGIIKQRIGENGDIYIVDNRGRVIYHQNSDQFGEDLSHFSVVEQVLSGQSGAIRTSDTQGQRIVAGYAPIPGTGWGLIHEESWRTITQGSRPYQQLLVLLLVLGVIVPILVVAFGVRRIMEPIDKLITGAQEVARGNFNQTVAASTGDQIEELAHQFNLMAGQLQASYAQLEQRVADRTQELATLYQADEELLAHLKLDDLLQALVDLAVDVLKADKSSVFTWDEQQQHWVIAAARGFKGETIARAKYARGEGVLGRAAESGQPAIVEDTLLDTRVVTQITEPEGIRAFMHVPIKVKDQVTSIFNFSYLAPRRFSDEEQRIFIALAKRAGLAIENARLYEQAQLVATVEERQRLARELHDAVTQTLFSSSLIAEVLPRLWERDPQEGRRRLQELRTLTRGALAEMRTLLMELRPSALMQAELGDLLTQLGEAFTGQSRLPVSVELDCSQPVPPQVKISLYRIAQEALNNVFKHAKASQVSIFLSSQPDGIELSIADDGRGFDPEGTASQHLGLRIMHERASEIGARLQIDSQSGAGTKIVAAWTPSEPAGGTNG
jgi:nitrate/nitrite-specific signal transduction histidine kinase